MIAASCPRKSAPSAGKRPSNAEVPMVKPAAPACRTQAICCGLSIDPATMTGLGTAAHTALTSAGTSQVAR